MLRRAGGLVAQSPYAPPLSLSLRDLEAGGEARAHCSFGEPYLSADCFPAFISSSRSVCLSVSGAVAPSAPTPERAGLSREEKPRNSAITRRESTRKLRLHPFGDGDAQQVEGQLQLAEGDRRQGQARTLDRRFGDQDRAGCIEP